LNSISSGATKPPIPVPWSCANALSVHSKQVVRRDDSQVGIMRDLLCPATRTVGEISFRQRLQSPSNAPEEMFPMA
jgi:hypothetical protein